MNQFQRIIHLREALGGRRFLLCVGCGVVASMLCAFGAIDGQTWALVVLGTIGAYIGGNTTQKVLGRKEAA